MARKGIIYQIGIYKESTKIKIPNVKWSKKDGDLRTCGPAVRGKEKTVDSAKEKLNLSKVEKKKKGFSYHITIHVTNAICNLSFRLVCHLVICL